VPPYSWRRFEQAYRGKPNVVPRPADALFYSDEQGYYLDFARRLGCDAAPAPYPFLPVSEPQQDLGSDTSTLVIAPGCKTGEMAMKRWPHFPALAGMFADVVLVGTGDDLRHADGRAMVFPSHVRSMVDRLSLLELAGVLAGCGTVVANDSGLGHMAAAVGAPTVLIFGPTPDVTLGRLPPNVTVLRSSLECQPCWFTRRFAACRGAITCLRELSLDTVAACVVQNLGATA
jgi:heptosyltransferase-2